MEKGNGEMRNRPMEHGKWKVEGQGSTKWRVLQISIIRYLNTMAPGGGRWSVTPTAAPSVVLARIPDGLRY